MCQFKIETQRHACQTSGCSALYTVLIHHALRSLGIGLPSNIGVITANGGQLIGSAWAMVMADLETTATWRHVNQCVLELYSACRV